MGKRIAPAGVRLDIVGLEPRLFDLCKQNRLAIIEQRTKGRVISSSESGSNPDQTNFDPALAGIPKDQLAIYDKLVSIAIDFERAYGRNVHIRIFERSRNRFLNMLFLGGRREQAAISAAEMRLVFSVNGIRVFEGIPNSFSELDEAIDNAFGRKSGRKDLV